VSLRDSQSVKRHLRFWRSNVRADVDDEMQFHIACAIDEYVATGLTREEARAQAIQKFGDVTTITKTLHTLGHQRERKMDRTEWLQSIGQDVRFALRQLRRNPGFTFVAVLTLALGIGATTAIFSVVNSVLLRPLPYANADRLLDLRERNGPADVTGMVVSYGNFASWRERSRSFDELGASSGDTPRTLTGVGDPLSLPVTRASAGYFRARYITPLLGRYFVDNEDVDGAAPVVVISEALWQSRFASDSQIIGKGILLSGIPHRVIGVAPRAYAMTSQSAAAPGIWLPLALTAAQKNEHADHELSVVALPKRGVSARAATAELTSIERDLAKHFPDSYFDGVVLARPLRDAVVGDSRLVLLVLFGAVGLVLLIACANVTNLLLARAISRQKEMAIRSALGGGRKRILRQLLIESIVLASAGAVIGLAIAAAGVRVLVQGAPLGIPRLPEVSLDFSMIAFTLLLSLLTGFAFGLLPAIRATRPDLQGTLREGNRDVTKGQRFPLRSSLVASQVAIALVLLVGAALLLRSGARLEQVSPGFDSKNVLVGSITLPKSRYDSAKTRVLAFENIVASAAALPGVSGAALISRIPIGNFGMDGAVLAEGLQQNDAIRVGANQRAVSPSLFKTFGIPVLRGREFTSLDRADAALVVVVNRSLARRLFGTDDVVGKRVSGNSRTDAPTWRTIVGVIGDVRANGLSSDAPNELYYPLQQWSEQSSMWVVIRGTVPVTTLIPAVRRAIATVDPLLPMVGGVPMEEVIARSLAVPRFTTQLLTLLGMLGLVLAMIGIYGVISYFVMQRTREIGVRIALGARPVRVVALVVRQALTLVIAGLAVGLVASWLSAGILQQLLFEVTAHDPIVFATVAAILIAVSIAACAVPAYRAAHVDPLVAMRS
jgi:putative ABC transport system permease protein